MTAKVSNGIGDVMTLIEGMSRKYCQVLTSDGKEYFENRLPDVSSDSLFIVTTQSMYEQLAFLGYKQVLLLKSYGFGNFYEMFSTYFGDTADSMEVMLKMLYTGFFKVDPRQLYICKAGVFYCWYVIDEKGNPDIEGNLQFSSSVTLCTVGKFLKVLYNSIVQSGCSVKNPIWLFWSVADYDADLSRYIKEPIYLSEGLGHIAQSYKDAYTLISKTYIQRNISAADLITLLYETRESTGFKVIKNGVVWGNTIKGSADYMAVTVLDSAEKLLNAGLILDCEGNSSGRLDLGFREIGGVLFQEYKKCLIQKGDFNADSRIGKDAFLTALEMTADLYPKGKHKIHIYTFGASDLKMLEGAFGGSLGAWAKRVEFVDVTMVLKSYVADNCIKIADFSLSGIANALGVLVHTPKHSAVNDAKTLFNILAKIKMDGKTIVAK